LVCITFELHLNFLPLK